LNGLLLYFFPFRSGIGALGIVVVRLNVMRSNLGRIEQAKGYIQIIDIELNANVIQNGGSRMTRHTGAPYQLFYDSISKGGG
jgi:hypothetical protein